MSFSKANQTGRTLLEMLGVISLMGALSVASVQLFGTAISRMHANDLLEAARSRVMMGNKKQRVNATYGMFEKSASEKSKTAYGYGIAATADELETIEMSVGSTLYSVITVPVGEINGGRRITSGLCKALVKRIHTDPNIPVKHGELLELCLDKRCNDTFDCESSEGEGASDEIPDILYLAIKK